MTKRSGDQVRESRKADEPIRLTPYDPSWPNRFEEERAILEEAIETWVTGGIHDHYPDDREAYTDAKEGFIRRILNR